MFDNIEEARKSGEKNIFLENKRIFKIMTRKLSR